FSNSSFEKKAYEEKIDYYRDLLITSLPDSSFLYKMAYSDKLNRYGKFDESLKITLPFYSTLPENSHERAMIAFNIAKAYVGKNDTTSQLKWFLLSSINDLRTSTKLYVSLKHISLILFARGDIDRSYVYIRKALEDATSCNAKLRAIEIAQFLPIIDKANLKIQNEHRINNLIMMMLISFFAFVLVVVIFVIYRQKNKLAKAREELSESNNQLQELNHELYLINVELKGTNGNLIESNHIKEEYIGKYMELCSVYINKMEDYRRNLNKLAIKGKTDNLIEEIKSKDFIDKEFKEFAMSFDQTFLYLFPTFVEDFNALLSKPEEINHKGGMHLSTELRIYALIRLGINDSVKISHFLGCSMSTIYNYKARIRFKALGNKDELESEVMKIGLH
ncbi:MAG TPA: DUF6377 domain-containing protein, partial [Paludibacter sp.]|nr:DUF6377 domain-containing protein [Paludibacter sp.]